MENRCELRINLVNENMPKMLTGMPQKGEAVRIRYSPTTVHSCCTAGEKAAPNLSGTTLWNAVSPMSFRLSFFLEAGKPERKCGREDRGDGMVEEAKAVL
jgi:hypothetical protein